MERQKPFKAAMSGGAILGALFVVNFFLSVPQLAWLNALTYLIEIAVIYVAYRLAKNYRDTTADGTITFSEAFRYIFMLVIYGSIIAAVVKLIYLKYINTDFLTQQLNQAMQVIDSLGTELPEETEATIAKLLQPAEYALYNLLGDCFLGLILALILAPFIRKQQLVTEQTDDTQVEENKD